MTDIPSDKIFNWASGQAVLRSGEIGKLLEGVEEATEEQVEYATTKLPDMWTYDPIKNVLVGATTRSGKILKQAWLNYGREIKRPAGKVMNPGSGRFVNVTGKIGEQIVGKWSCLRYGDRTKIFNPTDYQKNVAKYFVDSAEINNGILLYWGLGAGKTCGSILALDAYMRVYDVKKVYIFTTGSLRENFMEQYCLFCGEDPDKVQQDFEFITYNYPDVVEQLPTKESMENSIIIIDEVHIILHGVRNSSKTYVGIYKLLKSIDVCRFILLSGTPIVDHIDELYYLIKLLKPKQFKNRSYSTYFTNDGYTDVPSPELYDIVSDIISRVKVDDKNLYPEVFEINQPVTMTENQNYFYEIAREKEGGWPPSKRLEQSNPKQYEFQKRMFFLATTMKRSRQRGNMVYPDDIQETLDDWKTRALIKTDRLVENGGWITDEFVENLEDYSPKIAIIIETIRNTEGKHVIYSEFKNRYGVHLIAGILKKIGISYLLFTGDIKDVDRRKISDLFNDKDTNLHGEKYKVLLITKAGGIGQSFYHARALYILEQSVSENEIKQVIGRVIRYKSHIDLPENERNVTIVRFFSVTPPMFDDDLEEYDDEDFREGRIPEHRITSDFLAYNRGMVKEQRIKGAYEMLDQLPAVPVPSQAYSSSEEGPDGPGEEGPEEDEYEKYEYDEKFEEPVSDGTENIEFDPSYDEDNEVVDFAGNEDIYISPTPSPTTSPPTSPVEPRSPELSPRQGSSQEEEVDWDSLDLPEVPSYEEYENWNTYNLPLPDLPPPDLPPFPDQGSLDAEFDWNALNLPPPPPFPRS